MASNALAKDVPTVEDLIRTIQSNRQKFAEAYEKGKKDWTARTFRSRRDQQAFDLYSVAQKSPNPDAYLATLLPYGKSQLDIKEQTHPRLGGRVQESAPNIAEVYSANTGAASTVPHELEHTLQLQQMPQVRGDLLSFGRRVPQGALGDVEWRKLQERRQNLPAEQHSAVFDSANAMSSTNEQLANIAARAQNLAAQGVSFLDTPEGKALYPDRAAQEYYYATVMPGIPKMYGFREDIGAQLPPVRRANPSASYANQLYNSVLRYLGK